MKITLGKYCCESCSFIFEAPMLDDSSYGEFLLWSPNGRVAYLNGLRDPTYREFSTLLKINPSTSKLDSLSAAKVLQHMYGPLACDPDDAGLPFAMDSGPKCPSCGSHRFASWEMIHPPKIVEMDIPPVTHISWNKLSIAAKLELISLEVSKGPS
jgi:hypothetical protein